MKSPVLLTALATVSLGISPHTLAQSAPDTVQASDLVNLFETLSGPQPGHRKAHARGVCASGRLVPSQSEAFAGAPILSSAELPVSLRFSIGGGNPQADERVPGTRGMGMRVALPDGSYHTLAGNNFPVLAGKTPEIFFGFMSTLLPDETGQRDPEKTAAYIKAHPSTWANAAWQQQVKTAASYANTEYFGLHTFYYNGEGAEQVKFRWQLVPELGVETLDNEQAQAKTPAFLEETLARQLKQGEVSFTIQAIIGESTDDDVDPSVQWPPERRKVKLATVYLEESGDDDCTMINFDPTALSAGFSPSADPFLRMRSTAYAISFGKRLSGQ